MPLLDFFFIFMFPCWVWLRDSMVKVRPGGRGRLVFHSQGDVGWPQGSGRSSCRWCGEVSLGAQVLTPGQILVVVLWYQRYSSGNTFPKITKQVQPECWWLLAALVNWWVRLLSESTLLENCRDGWACSLVPSRSAQPWGRKRTRRCLMSPLPSTSPHYFS